MTALKIFWTIVMIVGIIVLVDAVVGTAFIVSFLGPSFLAIVGVPQIIIGGLLTWLGWKYSK